jgi:hypothetical protein
MHDQVQIAQNKDAQIALHQADAVTVPSDNWYDAPVRLDGSMEAMRACLEALAALTCQSDSASSAPILEFRFGDIVTMTSLLSINEQWYLSITALLPRFASDVTQSTAHLTTSAIIESARSILWHADKGCHVIVRKFLVSVFADERSVLDAIADTADEAAAWQESYHGDVPGR